MKAWACVLAVSVGMMALVVGCSSKTETQPATAEMHEQHTEGSAASTDEHSGHGSMSKADAAPAPAAAPEAIAQKTCPVMGGAIDENMFVEHEGRRVYFCCGGCEGTFKKDPATFLAKLDAELAKTATH